MKCFDWKWGIVALAVLSACSNKDVNFAEEEKDQEVLYMSGLESIIQCVAIVDEKTGQIYGFHYGDGNDTTNVYMGKDFSEVVRWWESVLEGTIAQKVEEKDELVVWKLMNKNGDEEAKLTLEKVNEGDEYARASIEISHGTDIAIKIPYVYRYFKVEVEGANSRFHFGQSVIVNITRERYKGWTTNPQYRNAKGEYTDEFGPGNYQYICVRPAEENVLGILLRATQTKYEPHRHLDMHWTMDLKSKGLLYGSAKIVHPIMLNNREKLKECYNNIPHSGNFEPTLSIINHGGSTKGYDDEANRSGDWYWTAAEKAFLSFTQNYAIAFRPNKSFEDDFTWYDNHKYRYFPIMQALFFDVTGKFKDERGYEGEKYFKVASEE